MENWKVIEDFPNYEVSDFGKVRRMNGGILMPCIVSKRVPYLRVSLMRDGKCFTRHVHRLVADAFCRKQEGCNCVDHIDGNKINNCASNLEWVTPKENTSRAIKLGLYDCSGLLKGGESVKRKILCVELNKTFDSFVEANEYFGKNKYNSSICSRLKTSDGKCWGKYFKYIA